MLLGSGVDDVTGVDLERVRANAPGQSGAMYWRPLELYNDVVRRIGRERGAARHRSRARAAEELSVLLRFHSLYSRGIGPRRADRRRRAVSRLGGAFSLCAASATVSGGLGASSAGGSSTGIGCGSSVGRGGGLGGRRPGLSPGSAGFGGASGTSVCVSIPEVAINARRRGGAVARPSSSACAFSSGVHDVV